MSQWTQVSGSIRIDGFIFGAITDEVIKESLEQKLGKIVTHESPREIWDLPKEKRTPMGSEGGISYEFVATASSESSMSRGTLFIEGSLRDYGKDEYKEIQEWLNRTLGGEPVKGDSFFIRQGVVEVEIEGDPSDKILLIWNGGTNLFEEHSFQPTPTTK